MDTRDAKLVELPAALRRRLQELHEIEKPTTFERPYVRGKFLYVGEKKFLIRGVTYGTFRPGKGGSGFPVPEVVEQDFLLMSQNAINCVRTYTVPPLWLLDCAKKHGLRVMVGLPWEQHITFLDNKERVLGIEKRMKEAVARLQSHPAILMYAIGNEIPPAIVRWYGRERIEKFLKRLYTIVKKEDPQGLVTYVNYPTTEYLQLNFLDVICFNVYLECREILESYLVRLHNLYEEKPLIMAEIGLDSQRNGPETQAKSLDWQIKSVFSSGCGGVFIFAWTDEWYRGGMDIEDWDFGITKRDRTAKPALSIIRENFLSLPFPGGLSWPKISIFVCSRNGSRTIRKTLTALHKLDYPHYEVVVVNDGSTDATPQIAEEFNVRLISTENRGLSMARNEALNDWAHEIVVYIDDDAYPDSDWLKYIAYTFITTDCAAVGGPNFLPLESGVIENCVGNAPGGATHVLINDREAEHIPGCNMAYRKSVLKTIGGFDAQFRAAGDDVDLCWRLLHKGWRIGYHPAASVWHYRRNRIKNYWNQQYGYGKAEAMLEEKWPDKYNAIGHIPWSGRLYGKGQTVPLLSKRWRIYQGLWGSALFQSIYKPAAHNLLSLPLLPEWYLVIGFLAGLSILGIIWKPLLIALPLFVLAIAAPIFQAVLSASQSEFIIQKPSFFLKIRLYLTTVYLHLLQPLARLMGRLQYGLTPLKCRGVKGKLIPRTQVFSIWREEWHSAEDYLSALCELLKLQNVPVLQGGDFDAWDLEVRGGLLGTTRVLLTIEEHGQGKQMLRFRLTPNFKIRRTWVIGFIFLLAILAGNDQALSLCFVLISLGLWLTYKMLQKCAYSQAALLQSLEQIQGV